MLELIKKMFGSETAQANDEDALNAHLALTVLLIEAANWQTCWDGKKTTLLNWA